MSGSNLPTGVMPRLKADTSLIPTVGNLDLDGARRYAERLQKRWMELQNNATAADRKLAIAQAALEELQHVEARVKIGEALAAVQAARELL